VMTINRRRLALAPRGGESPHHPIDAFFDSLAASEGHRSIGVVLSGTANDGTAGLAAIKAAGGITIAQDRSALYEGMPRSAITAGRVDLVLPPAGIASELVRIARHPYLGATGGDVGGDAAIDHVLAAVRHGTGVDFSQYKSNSLHRRIR